jgi:DNA-binding response OmpR family regulator
MSTLGSLLLIDDEPQVVDLLRDYFHEQGYSVMSALNGRDALVLASLTRPDAVLLDIRMPEMQGPEVLRGLHTLDDSITVVMLSGTDDEDLARDLLKAGAFDYVRKPFMFEALEDIVRLAVLMGRREPPPDVDSPPAREPWALPPDTDEASTWCALCHQAIPAGDTTAVRDRGSMFHAACWLRRSVEDPAPASARQLVSR